MVKPYRSGDEVKDGEYSQPCIPSFIFNILNREISSEEEGSSRRTQLSGLVELLRSSLEITEKLSITLEEELRFVRTYLNLQAQGLGPDFRLEWNLDPSLDTDAIYLPAMLIQIPVENAVKHGLCAIEGEKRLSVFVERDGKGIHIRIEDNGPGIVRLRMRDITVRGWERKSFTVRSYC